ncbi:MAG: hypothetical protein KDK74_04835, partial [Cephaloticoccus sp.]|nr:hypothetical protein [Cephaloticoccus sp.]
MTRVKKSAKSPANPAPASASSSRSAKHRPVRTRVALVGASGYTGVEALRLLLRHPGVRLTALCAGR